MWLELSRPYALALLGLVPVLVLLQRNSLRSLSPGRRRFALGIRLAVLLFLVLGLAGPRVLSTVGRLAVAYLVDVSDSVSPGQREAATNWVRQALVGKAPDDQAAVIAFGGDALVDRGLSKSGEVAPITSRPDGSHTNLAGAVRLALGLLPTEAARKLVVLSDGNENTGRAADEARVAAAAGVPISVVPLSQTRGEDVLVRQLDVPGTVRENENFSIRTVVEATGDTAAQLHLLVDGRLFLTQAIDLHAGNNTFVFPHDVLPRGFHVFQAQVESEHDSVAENNEATAYAVVGGKPHLLVVEGQPGEAQFLIAALRAGGLTADLGTPAATPSDPLGLRSYDSVVLANVPASALSLGQMQALQSYVQNFGGGLVVVGGDHTYGVGAYSRTPLEEMLPVQMDLRGRRVASSVAMVLVIDSSGSMAGGQGTSKMDLAKEAALRAIELLGDQDQVGVLAFEERPTWIAPVTFLTQRDDLTRAIGTIAPGGGTDINPALQEAYLALTSVQARVKHVILLTDGLSPPGDYGGLLARMKRDNISLSTVAVGTDADIGLLQTLAEGGNGRYYEGTDPFDVPQLLVKETLEVAREAIVEEPFRPIPVAPSPILEGIDATRLPPLRGYVATAPKPASTVSLASDTTDPILAEWQYGLGVSVAWTSDAKNRWASAWVDWPSFSQFWANVVKRTIPAAQDQTIQMNAAPSVEGALLTVDSVADDQTYRDFLDTRVTVTDAEGRSSEAPLHQVAPGRYEGQVPAGQEGAYFLQVTQTDPRSGRVVATQAGGYVVPYSPEYRQLGTDREALSRLAQQTGGKVLVDPREAMAHDVRAGATTFELWPAFLILAVLAFIVDAGTRRIKLQTRDVERAWGFVNARVFRPGQERVRPAAERLLAAKRRLRASAEPGAGTPVRGRTRTGRNGPVTEPTSSSDLSARLLAAKKRSNGRPGPR